MCTPIVQSKNIHYRRCNFSIYKVHFFGSVHGHFSCEFTGLYLLYRAHLPLSQALESLLTERCSPAPQEMRAEDARERGKMFLLL
jgi:hypothetical protein